MAALTQDRDTKQLASSAVPANIEIGVAASTKIYAGSLVCDNASGYATPGATATTLIALGMAGAHADNSSGAADAIKVKVLRGIFRFGNSSAGDEIAIDDRGKDCYIVDDQTVALTDGTSTRSKAGVVWDVDSDGVWVYVGFKNQI